MLLIIFNLVVLAAATVFCEYLWRTKKIGNEGARKFMHIFGGILAAFWPLYLSWQAIQLLFLISAVALLVMRFSGVIHSIFAVKRQTIGDIIAPLVIGLLAFFEPPQVLFVLVVLQVSLADGMAALVGSKFGKSTTYKIFGYNKSIIGTLTCFIFSLLIMIGIYMFGNFGGIVSPAAIILIPAAVAIVENLGIYGTDNALIALTVGGLAKWFNFY